MLWWVNFCFIQWRYDRAFTTGLWANYNRALINTYVSVSFLLDPVDHKSIFIIHKTKFSFHFKNILYLYWFSVWLLLVTGSLSVNSWKIKSTSVLNINLLTNSYWNMSFNFHLIHRQSNVKIWKQIIKEHSVKWY